MKSWRNFFVAAWMLPFVALSVSADEIKIGFWNVENLFDEFRDEGNPKASVAKVDELATRLANRAKIIKEIDVDILGVCEVENRRVLRQLVEQEQIASLGYKYFAVLDEKDERGMDVGLISKRPFFCQTFDVAGFYRGILACRFTHLGQPFYVVVNHWKSRAIDGKVKTAPLRMECARRLLKLVNEDIPAVEGRAVPVIIVGDLNDDDFDPSVKSLEDAGFTNTLKNFPKEKKWSLVWDNRDEKRVEYNHFDHIFLNPETTKGGLLKWTEGNARIFKPEYMLRKRRLYGEYYDWPDDDYGKHIGYSDHFPVVATFELANGK